ncbi:glycerate kinase family protein [Rhodococcus sp. SGAir0479]|uniref:glycerate kinase family protein n=1 Tax=Rhodococcus sp. SGAir0479 TaxID=2567884 RepID=UPI0010CD2ECE|nr:glycerate kinase [Rhodococcus sp. SGAir0479]QCQ91544.1 glycerate kinase [Rhodococcus sp. SGAir0479]
MRVLIAPDSFGETLTAVQAADAMAAGWRSVRPADDIVRAPQSDGGPAFVDVISGTVGGRRASRVAGPLDAETVARWVLADGTAYIESAQAVGLGLLGGPPNPDTALRAHSRGVGQLLAAAVAAGARRIVVGLGGSCCTDGGRGLVAALGGLDRARSRLAGVEVVAATDVEHPLLGEHGAARVFGPQKGADADAVAVLEQRNVAWAAELAAAAGRDVADLAGAGAAGGLGAALLALGGVRASGAAVVAEVTDQARQVAAAQLVLTGEGKFDHQSLRGKLVTSLARVAAEAGVPIVLVAGQIAVDREAVHDAGIAAAFSIAESAGSVERAMAEAASELETLTARVAGRAECGATHEE